MKKSGQKPLFSVVIPCYNLGEYVDAAISSVESQTLRDVEIIIVDDASPNERTKQMLSRLESRAKIIYRDKNGGASAARNTGVSAARAEYVLCLDSDDTIAPDYLRDAYNLLSSRPDVGVVAAHTRMTGQRDAVWQPKAENATFPQALVTSPIPNASCYRKQAWKDAGGYDENMRGYEDWEFWISILEKDWLIEVIPKPHYIYFNRPGSKVKTSNKNAHAIVNYIVTKHEETYRNHMNFVIAATHKKYVDMRTQVLELQGDNPQRGIKKLKRIPRKIRTASKLLITEGDYREFTKRVRDKIKR